MRKTKTKGKLFFAFFRALPSTARPTVRHLERRLFLAGVFLVHALPTFANSSLAGLAVHLWRQAKPSVRKNRGLVSAIGLMMVLAFMTPEPAVAATAVKKLSPGECRGWGASAKAQTINLGSDASFDDFSAATSATYRFAPSHEGSIGIAAPPIPLTCLTYDGRLPKNHGLESATAVLSLGAKTDREPAGAVAAEFSVDDGRSWRTIGTIPVGRETSNRTNGGQWRFSLPAGLERGDLEHVGLRVRFAAADEFAEVELFVDGVSLEVTTLKQPGVPILERLFDVHTAPTILIDQKTLDEVEFLDADGKPIDIPHVQEVVDGKTKITMQPGGLLRPGTYVVRTKHKGFFRTVTEEQSFQFGVANVNTSKAVYEPGDLVTIAMGVLDDRGETVCDAALSLRVTKPDGTVSLLSTNDTSILGSPTCGPKSLTNLPDYSATFLAEQQGTYRTALEVGTGDETRVIEGQFEVQPVMPFAIERIAPTRINPKAAYFTRLRITPAADFQGRVEERVPLGFVIDKLNPAATVLNGDDVQTVGWDVSWEKGETYELSYAFNAPDVSPALYAVGPLRIGDATEARSWTISADEVVRKEREVPFDSVAVSDADFSEAKPDLVDVPADVVESGEQADIKVYKEGYELPDAAVPKGLDPAKPVTIETVEVLSPENDTAGLAHVSETFAKSGRELEVLHLVPEQGFTPGVYRVMTTLTDGTNTVTETETFAWGVLALNTPKSVYAPHEPVEYWMGAVDSDGHTVCQAPMELTVTAPDATVKTFSTTEQTIRFSEECGPITVTNAPDYQASDTTAGAGEYQLKLTATIEGRPYIVEDVLHVEEDIPFTIVRSAPTRLYPLAEYDLLIRITPREDYHGTFTEWVPVTYDVLAAGQGGVIGEARGDSKPVIWTVDWKAATNNELTYRLDPEDRSPARYTLGPAEVGSFKELRQWQIASDAVGGEFSTRLYTMGFELNSVTAGHEYGANIGTTPSISTDPVRSGTYALRTNLGSAATSGINWDIAAADMATGTAFRAYLRVATGPGNNNTISVMEFYDNAGTAQASVRLAQDGSGNLTLKYCNDEDDASCASPLGTSSTLSTNTWYRVEMYADFDTAATADSEVEAKLDGTTFATLSTTINWANGFRLIRLGILSSGTGDLYWDDVAVDQDVFEDQRTYPGDGKIVRLTPNGSGTDTAWTGDYTSVDEVTPDDATTALTCNTGNEDFTYPDASSAGIGSRDTVRLIEAWARTGGAATSSNRSLRLKLASGNDTNEETGTAIVIAATSTYYTNDDTIPRNADNVIYDKPAGGSSYGYKPLEPSDVDSIQTEMTGTDCSPSYLVTTVWLLVEYVPAEHGRLWSSGVENGTDGAAPSTGEEWSGVNNTPTVSTTVAHGGSFSLRANGWGSGTNESVTSQFEAANGDGPYFIRAYLRVATAPDIENRIIVLNDSGGTDRAYMTLNSSLVLTLYDEDGSVGSHTAIATNRWYRVEIKFDSSGAGATDTIESKVNGGDTVTSSTRNLTNGVFNLQIGGNLADAATTTGDWYFDDIAINTNAGSSQNGYPGDAKIVYLRPNATGDNSAWTNDYTTIDEVDPSTADVILSTTANQIEDVNLTDTGTAGIESTATISLVSAGVHYNVSGLDMMSSELRLKDAADARQIGKIIQTTGTTDRTNTEAVPFLYQLSVATRPHLATAWTPSTLDSAQIGVRIINDSASNMQIGAMWLLVEYAPPSITVSGGCFTDESEGTGCTNDASDQIVVAVAGEVVHFADTTVDSSWSFTIWQPASGASLIFFRDGEATASEEATTVTLYDGSGDVDQVKMYQSQLVIGTDAGSANSDQTVTNANLDDFMNSNDEDVIYSVVSGTLTVDKDGDKSEQLYIISGDTFRPDSVGGATINTLNVEFEGTLTLDNNAMTVSGNYDNDGVLTASTSTITFDATDTDNTIDADGTGADSFSSVTFSGAGAGNGTWTLNTNMDVAATLNVNTGDTLSIDANQTLTHASGAITLTLDGTISGAGRFTYKSSTAFPATGTISSILRFDMTDNAQTLTGTRTMGGNVEVYNNSTTARTLTLGSAISQTLTFSGNLTVEAANTANATVSGTLRDPTVNVTGDIDYVGTGSGTEFLSTGDGTWTVSGNVDVRDGNLSGSSVNTFEMNGTSKTLAGTINTGFNHLRINGTVTVTASAAGDSIYWGGTLTVKAAKTLTVNASQEITSDVAGAVTVEDTGALTGAGRVSLAYPPNLATTGTISSVFRYDMTFNGGTPATMPARSFGSDLELYSNEVTTGETFRFAAGTHTISGNLLLIAANTGNVTADGATNDPAVTVTGGIDFTGAGAGTEILQTGAGAWNVGGSIDTTGGTFTAETSNTVTLNGSSTQTITGAPTFYNLAISNTSGSVSGCATSFTAGVDFAAGATVSNNYTIGSGNHYVEYNSGSTYAIANINWNAGIGNAIYFRNSSLASGTWLLNVSGTQTDVSYVNVGRSDASGSASAINAANGTNTDCLNNVNWTFSTGISITGTAYTDDTEAATVTDGTVICVAVNAGPGTTCDSDGTATGVFVISSISSNSGDQLTVFIDGGSIFGNTVTKSDGGNIVAGDTFRVYQDHVVVRYETGTALAIVDMDAYDNDQNATDILFDAEDATPDTLTVESGKELFVQSGYTFTPAGNLFDGVSSGIAHLDIRGTFTAGASGDYQLSGNFANAGTYTTASSETITMTGTSNSFAGGGSTYANVTINPSSAGTITFQTTDATIAGTLTVAAGDTLSIASGRTLTHTGATLTWGDGTSTISGSGTLRFTDTSGGPATGGVLSSVTRFDASSSNIASTTFDARTYSGKVELFSSSATAKTVSCADASTYSLSGSSSHLHLIANGDGGLSLLCDTATDPTITIGGDLDFQGTGAGSESITSGAGTWTVSGNADFTGGTYTATSGNTLTMDGTTKTLTTAGSSLYNFIESGGSVAMSGTTTVTNDLTISGGTLTAPTSLLIGGNFDNDAAFTHNTGTVTFNAASGTKTIDADGTGADSFNDLTFNDGGGPATFQLTAALDVNDDLLITGGTITSNSNNINLGGDWTNNDIFTANATVTFDGGATQTVITGGTGENQNFSSITVTGTSTNVVLSTNAIDIDSGFQIDANATFNASGLDMDVGGAWTNAGTFTSGLNTVTFSGASTTITTGGTGDGQDFNNVILNKLVARTWTLQTNAIDIDGNLTITQGQFVANGLDVFVAGNWSNSDTYTSGSNTTTFDGSLAQTVNTGGTGTGQDFQNVTVSGASVALLTNAIDIDGTFTLTGTFSTNNLAMTVSGGWDNDGTFNAGSGTVTFAATSGTNTIDADGTGADAFNHIVFNDNAGTAIWQLTANMDVDGNLTITGGEVQAQTNTINLAGNWSNSDLFTEGTSTVIFDSGVGGQTITTNNTVTNGGGLATTETTGRGFYHVTINSGGTVALAASSDLSADGNLTFQAGVLDIGSNDNKIILKGDWDASLVADSAFDARELTYSDFPQVQLWGSSTQKVKIKNTNSQTFDSIQFGDIGQASVTRYLSTGATSGTLNYQDYLVILSGTLDTKDGVNASVNVTGLGASAQIFVGDTYGEDSASPKVFNANASTITADEFYVTDGQSAINSSTFNAMTSTLTVVDLIRVGDTGNATQTYNTFDASTTSTATISASRVEAQVGTVKLGLSRPWDVGRASVQGYGIRVYAAGTLDGATNSSNSAITVAGDFIVDTGGTFSAGSTTITLDGTVAQKIDPDADLTFNNLTLDDTGNRTITIADVDTSSRRVTVSGTFTWDGTTPANAVDVQIGSTTFTAILDLTNATAANSAIVIPSGRTLTMITTSSIELSGNWTNNGTFTRATSTVLAEGSNQQTFSGTMTGTSQFYALTVTNASGSDPDSSPSLIFAAAATVENNFTATTANTKLRFASGSTYTFQNISFNGQGTGTRVFLRSSTNGTQWNLNVAGTRSVSYANVKDSNACGQPPDIDATNGTNVDAANNSCWDFNTLTFTVSDNTIGFGALSAATGRWATGDTNGGDALAGSTPTAAHTMTIATNAPSGYAITYNGATLTSGGNTVDVASVDEDSDGTPGTEQYGLSVSTDGNATIATGYLRDTAADFSWVASTTTTIVSETTSTATETLSASYLANITAATESGTYTTTVTYIASGTF